MRPGAPRKLKSPWASREAARGHEPVAELGRPPDTTRFRSDLSAILAATSGQSPSVVQVRTQDLVSEQSVGFVTQAINSFRAEIDRGALLSIAEGGTRVRMLPLRPSQTDARRP